MNWEDFIYSFDNRILLLEENEKKILLELFFSQLKDCILKYIKGRKHKILFTLKKTNPKDIGIILSKLYQLNFMIDDEYFEYSKESETKIIIKME
jgi:hypothetical protein